MTDEHAPQYTSAYGCDFIRTPNLGKLAEEGITFESAYCPAPLCVPSRMSFMSGLQPHKVGIWDNGCTLSSDEITWAHIFRRNGYDAVLNGRMHFIGPDQMHGFSARPVAERKHTRMVLEHAWEDGVIDSNAGGRIKEAGSGDSIVVDYDKEVTRGAVEFLRNRSLAPTMSAEYDDARKQDKPFALCIGYVAPHFPLICPEEYYSLYYPDKAGLPKIPYGKSVPSGNIEEAVHPADAMLHHYFSLEDEFDEDTIQRARAAYFGLITFMDEQVGEILKAVEECGFSDDTIVIYTSDHGELLGEHGLWWKCSFYEQSVKIPLIIKFPASTKLEELEGLRIAAPVSLLDVMPTLFDELEFTDIPYQDGRSLWGLLRGTEKEDIPVVSEYLGHGITEPTRMVRWKQYKYIYVHNYPSLLFDLNQDPDELNNLSGSTDLFEIETYLHQTALNNWDPNNLKTRVIEHQNKRRYILKAEGE